MKDEKPQTSSGLQRFPAQWAAGSSLARVAVVLVSCGVLFGVALTRPLDEDEGLYQYASYLVSLGRLPYRDFAYPQLPYLLYVYLMAGSSLWHARALSVLLGGLLVWFFTKLASERSKVWLLATIMLLLNGSFLAMTPIFKSYAFTMAASLIAFYCLTARSYPKIFLSGLAMGAVCATRLFYLPIPLLHLIYLIRSKNQPSRAVQLYLIGLAVAAAPCSLFVAVAPEEFMSGVVGVHAFRSADGMFGEWEQKWMILGELFGNPQLLILGTLVVIGAFKCWNGERLVALGTALVLGIMSFLPTPTFTQYFVCLLPFLAFLSIPGLEHCVKAVRPVIFYALFALYIAAASLVYRREVVATTSISDVLPSIAAVVNYVNEHVSPGDTILSLYPGYAVWTNTFVPHGLENSCIFFFGTRVPKASRELLGVASFDDVTRWIQERSYPLVIFKGLNTDQGVALKWLSLLDANGYRQDFDFGGTRIYRRLQETFNLEDRDDNTLSALPFKSGMR